MLVGCDQAFKLLLILGQYRIKIILTQQLIQKYYPHPMHHRGASLLNFASIQYIRLVLYCIVLSLLPSDVVSLSMGVTSASSMVGATTNYTLTITNHSKPVTIRIQFSQWSPWQAQPYTSNYQFYLNSGSFSNVLLSCRPRFGNALIQCTSPTPNTQLGPTLELRITNIYNPSSTKPFPITVILLYADASSQSATSNLTVSSLPTSDITLSGYNNTLGMASTSVTWILSFDYYFDFGTVLRMVYDSRLITLGFSALTGAVATTTNASNIITAKLTNWSDTASGLHFINFISVTNPQASLSTTVACTLQFTQSGITYSIQKYTATFNIITAYFTSITGTTTLQLGQTGQTISLSALNCPYTAVEKNLTSNVSQTEIIFSTIDITASTCTTPTITNTTKNCRYNTVSFPKQITGVTQVITSKTITVATITTYTYYAALTAYTPLCSQVYNITLLPQQIASSSISFNTALCGTGTTGQLNSNTRLIVKLDSAAVGDIVTVTLAMGLLAGNWVRVANTSTYKYVIVASDLVNSTHVNVAIPYTNPTYTTTANTLSALIFSRIITNSTETIYARINPTNLTIPICPVPTSSQLQSFTISLSSTTTYSLTTTTIRYKNKFTDYTDTDYLRIQYKFYDNLLYLTTPEIAGNITMRLTTNGASSNCPVTVINNTILNVYNISRINMVGIINEMQLQGIVNPSAIYPIVSGATGFQIIITLVTASGIEKEQATAQFSSLATQTSYAYITKSPTVTQSKLLPILKSGISFTLTLNNTLKSKYYASMPTTTVSINLPFLCTQTNSNGTILISWQSFSSSLLVNLTNCNIGYFNSTGFTFIISQYLMNGANIIPSTSVLYTASLACKDNCLECLSNQYCTSCVNSTFTYYLLYNGLCYSTCPQKTYQSGTQSICQSCHPSCLTCNGSQLTSCTTCQTNYFSKPINTSTQSGVTRFQNICVSVCGEGRSLNTNTNVCQPCQIDCKFCIDSQYCYFCKSGASEVVTGKCDFTVCTDPCKSCQGTMTNCTGCSNQMYLYQFQCYTTCPTNTYPNITAGQPNICMDITSPTLYFPVTICSIVFIVLVCICNSCIERGLTADTQRRNINMLSYSSSILALMELFALFIMIASTYSSNSRGLGIAGLLVWIICNALFGVYYFKVIRNDEAVITIVDKMSSQTKCIYYATVGFSVIVALRVYRVLYCGLFRGVAPYPVKKKMDSTIRKRKPSEGRIANQNIDIIIQQNQPVVTVGEPVKPQKQKEPKPKAPPANLNGKATSMSTKTIKNIGDVAPLPPIAPKGPVVDKNEVIEEQQNTSQQSTEQHSKFQLKRPYIIYITIGSLLASILFLAAGISEITKNAYPAMLFWGLDILIVVIASMIVTVLDMWAGVKKSYLMALDKGPVNQTMQNLRVDEDEATQQKILTNAKATQKVNKSNSPTKKKGEDQKKSQRKKYQPPPNLIRKKSSSPRQKVLSPQQKQQIQKANKLKSVKSRYSDLYKRSKKPEQDSESNDQDQLPDIKVFEDIQMFPNDEIEPKKIKKVKGDNKRMTSMQNIKKGENRSVLGQSSNATLAKNNKMNWKVEDIFLGFKDEDGSEIDNKTVKLVTDRNGLVQREIYKLEGKKEDKSEQSGEDQSYINSLQRQKNRKDQDPDEGDDINQNKFNFE